LPFSRDEERHQRGELALYNLILKIKSGTIEILPAAFR